jgi:hypothetical protein
MADLGMVCKRFLSPVAVGDPNLEISFPVTPRKPSGQLNVDFTN